MRYVLNPFIAVAASLSLTAAPATAAADPLVLKATSAWHVDYADDRCRLARRFGIDEQHVLMLFDRYGPGESFRFTLAGKPVKTSLTDGEATLQFGTESAQKVHFFAGNLDEDPALVFSSGMRVAPLTAEEMAFRKAKPTDNIEIAPIGPERETAIKSVRLGKPFRRELVLETGSMRAPFAALNTCIDNLLTHWGIDVKKHKTLSRPVKAAENPGRWVVSSDYPTKMLTANQPAIVEFRLSVGVDGKPTACHIQSTTRPKEFDNAVCKSLMRRARFFPALDAEGRPLASYYRNTVRFQIPY